MCICALDTVCAGELVGKKANKTHKNQMNRTITRNENNLFYFIEKDHEPLTFVTNTIKKKK